MLEQLQIMKLYHSSQQKLQDIQLTVNQFVIYKLFRRQRELSYLQFQIKMDEVYHDHLCLQKQKIRLQFEKSSLIVSQEV